MIKLALKSVKYIIIIGILALAGYFYFLPKIENSKKENTDNKEHLESNEYLIVSKVIDGDTFKMSNGEKVRLLGIDTPEKFESDKLEKEVIRSGRDRETIQKLGEAASDYVRNMVEGKKVTLVRDPGCDDKDKYGRSLRYIYLEDGTFVNEKILEDGYANIFNSPCVTKLNEFRKLEKQARENKKGLWGEGLY